MSVNGGRVTREVRFVLVEIKIPAKQRCRNPRRQVYRATKFCIVAPNICGPTPMNLLHIILLAPRILRWLLGFFFFLFGKCVQPAFVKIKLLCAKLNTTPWGDEGAWRCNSAHVGGRVRRLFSFTPRPPYPEKRAPGTHWIGSWADAVFGLRHSRPNKFMSGIELWSLRSQVTIPNELWVYGTDNCTVDTHLSSGLVSKIVKIKYTKLRLWNSVPYIAE